MLADFIGRRAARIGGSARKEVAYAAHRTSASPRPRTRWPRTGTSATSPGRASRPARPWPSRHSRRATGSSCSVTAPAGCTTTSGWRSTGCSPAGPFRRAPRSTRRCAARRSTSRTTRSSTSTSRGSSRPASTAAATSSSGTPAPGSHYYQREGRDPVDAVAPRRAAHGAGRPEAARAGSSSSGRPWTTPARRAGCCCTRRTTFVGGRAGTRRSIRVRCSSGRTNDEVKADPDRLWRSDLPAAEAAIALHPPTFEPATRAELRALDRLGASGTWEVFGRELRVTNLDKVLFPARRREKPVTKRDLVRYAAQIAPTARALPDAASAEHAPLPERRWYQRLLAQGAARPRARHG